MRDKQGPSEGDARSAGTHSKYCPSGRSFVACRCGQGSFGPAQAVANDLFCCAKATARSSSARCRQCTHARRQRRAAKGRPSCWRAGCRRNGRRALRERRCRKPFATPGQGQDPAGTSGVPKGKPGTLQTSENMQISDALPPAPTLPERILKATGSDTTGTSQPWWEPVASG
eukprot:536330-Amphidinium_carterae.3